jgi:hypothetical protein
MRDWATIAAAAAALGSSQPAAPLGQRDFQDLMQAAVAVGAANWGAPVQNICVQRELEAPLKFMKRGAGLGWRSSSSGRYTANAGLDASLAKAMSPQAPVAPETTMPPLGSGFIIFSSKAARPKQCLVPHDLGMARGAPHQLSVAITFTRPAFADGMAFINEVDDCPALCGDGVVRAFRKLDGKWTQVADAILWVS